MAHVYKHSRICIHIRIKPYMNVNMSIMDMHIHKMKCCVSLSSLHGGSADERILQALERSEEKDFRVLSQ